MQEGIDEELLIRTLKNEIRVASENLTRISNDLQQKIPDQEQTNNFERVEKELQILISKQPNCKEQIIQLSKPIEKIDELDSEQSASILANFHSVNELTSKVWELFKYSDINPSDERILQLMDNYSKDIFRSKIEQLQKLDSENKFGFFDCNPQKMKRFEKLKEYADIYLVYHTNHKQFKENQELMINHTSELINSQSSLRCAQQ